MANKIKLLGTAINIGDIIGVYQKIKEADKERIQVFKGAVIAIKGKGEGKSFTVRRLASGGIGVERIWPVLCPSITKIKIIRKGKVRRAKLYYLREKVGREATRIKTKREELKATKVSKVSKSKKKAKNAKKKPGKSGRKSSSKASPKK